jgi:glycosyltransferase involved in cell wall biosynthesis
MSVDAPTSADSPRFSLVLPLYDEEESVVAVARGLVEALESAGERFELILVDNGSRDRTRELVEELRRGDPRVVCVALDDNRGFGGGVLAGFSAARGDLVGFMGGDGQVTPSDLVDVLGAVRRQHLDLAKGRRIARHDGIRRRVVSVVYNGLFRLVFGTRVADVNGSPKILRRELLQALALRSRDWFLDAEIVLKAHVLKARIGEVPITFGRRTGGGSHVRIAAIAEFLRNMIRYRFSPKSAWFGRKE